MSKANEPKYKRSREQDGKLMLAAAVALITSSGLLGWKLGGGFTAVERTSFENKWQQLDSVFGRAALWNMFSVGAENLVKAVLLCNDVGKVRGRPQKVHDYPIALDQVGLSMWARVVASGEAEPTNWAPNYGTLIKIVGTNCQNSSPLSELFARVRGSSSDTAQFDIDANLVFAAFDLLRSAIRNRDAHAYIPNVRDAHFDLASLLFLPAFNTLLGWVPPLDGKTLDELVNAGRHSVAASAETVSSSGGYPP